MSSSNYFLDNQCLYQELFQYTIHKKFFDETFLEILSRVKQGQTLYEIMSLGLIKEEFKNIYSMPIFDKRICDMIIEETENYQLYATKNNIEVSRPNSMNNYGLVLNSIGMKELLTDLQQNYILPISQILFPNESSEFTDHHTFTISYESDKDRALDMHTDDSDVTWNICLGKEGFIGSGLTFCGVMGEANHRHVTGTIQ
jgi:hypothetical protein